MIGAEALQKRSKYRVGGFNVLAHRRPPETGSSVLYSADEQYMLNKRCDVYDVGPGHWCSEMNDGAGGTMPMDIEIGDVIIVIPHDEHFLDKINDPNLSVIPVYTVSYDEDGNPEYYFHIHGVIKSKPYLGKIRTTDTPLVRAVEIDHYMEWPVVEPDGSVFVQKAVPGDYLVTNLSTREKYVADAQDFKDWAVEVDDAGQFSEEHKCESEAV